MIIDMDVEYWIKVFKYFEYMNVNFIGIEHLYHLYYECQYKRIYKRGPIPEFFNKFIDVLENESEALVIIVFGKGRYLYNTKYITERDLEKAIKKFEGLVDSLIEVKINNSYLIDDGHKEFNYVSKNKKKKIKIAIKDKATMVAIIYKLVNIGYRTIDLDLLYDCYKDNVKYFTSNFNEYVKSFETFLNALSYIVDDNTLLLTYENYYFLMFINNNEALQKALEPLFKNPCNEDIKKLRVILGEKEYYKEYNEVIIKKISIDEYCDEIFEPEFYALDIETKGFSKNKDRIVEVGIAKFIDGEVVDTFSSLVKTDKDISPYAGAVNGITDDMLEDAPSESVIATKIREFLDDAVTDGVVVVAHNANFDMGFLKSLFNRYNIDAHIKSLNTLEESRKYLCLLDHSLGTVAKHYKIKNKNAHRALDDAITCGKIFLKLLEEADNHFYS